MNLVTIPSIVTAAHFFLFGGGGGGGGGTKTMSSEDVGEPPVRMREGGATRGRTNKQASKMFWGGLM